MIDTMRALSDSPLVDGERQEEYLILLRSHICDCTVLFIGHKNGPLVFWLEMQCLARDLLDPYDADDFVYKVLMPLGWLVRSWVLENSYAGDRHVAATTPLFCPA